MLNQNHNLLDVLAPSLTLWDSNAAAASSCALISALVFSTTFLIIGSDEVSLTRSVSMVGFSLD